MSFLYIEDPKLIRVSSSLAVEVGLKQAIILSQVHFWVNHNRGKNRNFRDGYFWCYNTYQDWWSNDFPFLTTKTVKNIITELEKKGLLVIGNYNKMRNDRTKWYRIDESLLQRGLFNNQNSIEHSAFYVPVYLAAQIGLNEALFINRLYYWLKVNRSMENSSDWVNKSHEDWQKYDFPFLSLVTVKRTIKKLEAMDLIISSKSKSICRKKWYSINYKNLFILANSLKDQNGLTNVSKRDDQKIKMGSPLPNNITKNNSENKKGRESGSLPITFKQFIEYTDDIGAIEVVEHYMETYKDNRDQEHPRLKIDQWRSVVDNLFILDIYDEVDERTLMDMIDKHFMTTYKDGCDYNILHFMSGDIRKHRYFEVSEAYNKYADHDNSFD